MVVGIDGCVYGMEFIGPDPTYLDTIQLITSLHIRKRQTRIWCFGKRRMYLYVISTKDDLVHALKIVMTINSRCFVGSRIVSDHNGNGWHNDGTMARCNIIIMQKTRHNYLV